MLTLRSILALVFLFFSFCLSAQLIIGGDSNDFAVDIIEVIPKQYLLGATIRSYSAEADDVYLISLDSIGNQLWTKKIGTTHTDRLQKLIKTKDGNSLALITTYDLGPGDYDAQLIKLTSSGAVIWEAFPSTWKKDKIKSILEISNGFIIAGANAAPYIPDNVYVALTNTQGARIKDVNYQRIYTDYAFELEQVLNDVWVLINYSAFESYTLTHVAETNSYYGIRVLNEQLDSLKSWIYTATTNEIARDIKYFNNNVYVLGHAQRNLSSFDIFLDKLSIDGVSLERVWFGESKFEYGISLDVDSENQLIYILGLSASYSSDQSTDVVLYCIDYNHELKWQKIIGGLESDTGAKVMVDSEHRCIVTGSTESNGIFNIFVNVYDKDGGIIPFIGQQVTEFSWSVYPNPSNEYISFKHESRKIIEYFELFIYNAQGQLVYSDKILGNYHSIYTEQWAKGSYFYRMIDSNHQQIQGKLIVH